MRRKVQEDLEALRRGARGHIFSGRVQGNIYKAILGLGSFGTVVIY
jgi:isopentenyl phosphate kinase